MTKLKQQFLFAILLFCIVNVGFSQSNQIKVRFIGNCGLHFTDGTSNLYIDFPYKSGAYHYMTYDSTEIENIQENSLFLFTHKHADHYSKKLLKQVKSKRKGMVYGNWNTKSFKNLSNAIDDFNIEAIKTKHRFSFKHYSYLITWHGKKIYLSGDTESAETIASVKEINWAFVPIWIVTDAKKKNLTIDAEKIGIYHLYPNEKVTNSKPEKYLILDNQGEEIIIPY